MGLGDELRERVAEFLADAWDTRDGRVVPSSEDLGLDNVAVEFDDATVMYADISGSTALVDGEDWRFAAEVYKSFLYCAARIIAAEGGEITAYDGDRIMAVFLDEGKDTSAVRAGLKINHCAKRLLNPMIREQYPDSTYVLRHVVGIDASPIRVARTGARGANDLVWVGRAANYAAKLTSLPDSHPTRITAAVYGRLDRTVRYTGERPMWDRVPWKAMADMLIYRSTWRWPTG